MKKMSFSHFSYAESAEYKAGTYAPLYEKWKAAFDGCVDTKFGKNIVEQKSAICEH